MGDKEKERISQKGNIATEKGFLIVQALNLSLG